jgi:hypothetical protein
MRTHCDATSAVGDGKPSPALSRYLMPQPGTTDATYTWRRWAVSRRA